MKPTPLGSAPILEALFGLLWQRSGVVLAGLRTTARMVTAPCDVWRSLVCGLFRRITSGGSFSVGAYDRRSV